MYSVADMGKIFLSTNNVTDYQNDLHQYFEQNAPNQTIINYEEEGNVMSEPMSLSSSPVATDIQTGNCVHNPKESSERRDNGLCSIYEIRILYVTHLPMHSNSPGLKLPYFTTTLFNGAPFHRHTSTEIIIPQVSVPLQTSHIQIFLHYYVPLYIQECGKVLTGSLIGDIFWNL
jgi:hypothetical protein